MSVDNFKSNLSNIVKELSLDELNWSSEKWKSLSIDQEILTDAFEKHSLIKVYFSEIGDIITRKCKSIKRVEKKKMEQIPNRENYFKVISDFLAVRIHCDVNQIKEKIDYLKTIIISNGGYFHVRGSSIERPYGFFLDNNFKDIVQYVYVYLEKIGYIIEFQMGHEFATHSFVINSLLRDNPSCGKIDLWTDDFYADVKSFILNKANLLKFNEIDDKNKILMKANKIHNNNIPSDLLIILDKL